MRKQPNRQAGQRLQPVPGTPPATLDPLEPRRLLSASLDGRTLVIEGTRGDDVITVFQSGNKSVRVEVNGVGQRFLKKSFAKIRINAGRGDDAILFETGEIAGDVTRPAVIDAGAGNDTVTGGKGADRILGREGRDSINGLDGDDTVFGGAGGDFLVGGDDDDQLSGDSADDTLRGEDGDDTLLGGRGADFLRDDAGDDRLCGGRDVDRFAADPPAKDVRDEAEGELIFAPATPMPGEGWVYNTAGSIRFTGNVLPPIPPPFQLLDPSSSPDPDVG